MSRKPPYEFGESSKEALFSCDPRLQIVANEAIKVVDFTIICGHRSNDEQDTLFKQNKSKKEGGQSKHNSYPARAFDFSPWPVDWSYKTQFAYVAGIIMGIAYKHGIRLRYGGDWGQDGSLKNETFSDMGHLELMED